MKYLSYIIWILLIFGLICIIWSNHIENNYPHYSEICDAAIKTVLPQIITGFICLFGAYILTFFKKK
jgi:hypothetical protein